MNRCADCNETFHDTEEHECSTEGMGLVLDSVRAQLEEMTQERDAAVRNCEHAQALARVAREQFQIVTAKCRHLDHVALLVKENRDLVKAELQRWETALQGWTPETAAQALHGNGCDQMRREIDLLRQALKAVCGLGANREILEICRRVLIKRECECGFCQECTGDYVVNGEKA